ncbi:O-phosphoseryl-tRNA(Sec) selenium transferase-like isoform X3 [Glossina fuscipes]|uniref:O-phosphoseryl-tRNA(Sec) selenium transferase n=1 Tax=Glossina fuscipes TaxID=7396 RepID=A0A9C6DYR2_9MUSC|nr:O-phosphoseryl-tRNA(Sec) selenium transferase-like isoform X3 [Glossina fuscipes]
MNLNNLKLHHKLVPDNYLKLALEAQRCKEIQIKELLEKRKLPDVGWTEELIEYVIQQLAALDNNNFEHKIGLGEREARMASKLVINRNYGFGHGIGRSGDLLDAQPKAVGSTIVAQLSNALVLDVIRLQGINLKKRRPPAKYVLWSRIDQKSCFKSITTAGLTPIIIDTVKREEQDGLFTDLGKFEENLSCIDREEILCIMSTTSCFGPRNCDGIISLAGLAAKFDVPHVVNNAYGLQSTYLTHQLKQANSAGRVDLFVQSTDKNFMVPVGGAIVAGFEESSVHTVAKAYAGRASSSQSLDVLITLLCLGKIGYQDLVSQRKLNFVYLQKQLEEFAEKHHCRVIRAKANPISLALELKTLSTDVATKLGSMLFTRGVSGTRVIIKGCNKTIDGFEFADWGSHESSLDCAYLTAAVSIGLKRPEIDAFIHKLQQCWQDLEKKINKDT